METYTGPLGLPQLDAWASKIMYVRCLAQLLAHGRHLINGASIIIIVIAPVSSGLGCREGWLTFGAGSLFVADSQVPHRMFSSTQSSAHKMPVAPDPTCDN